jgi:hypothetical protein
MSDAPSDPSDSASAGQGKGYLAAAFNARPFGMPVPPNWFAVAAVGLLGAFVSPGIWLIGAGIEGLYLWALSRNQRFRATVDASRLPPSDLRVRYDALLERLDESGRRSQEGIERQARELSEILTRSGANPSQLADVRTMAWLHLKLLAARSSFAQVISTAEREHRALDEQAERLRARLERPDTDADLRRSLEQQLEVIASRTAAHADAERRRELVDAELERLRQQIALVKEQALLATDEGTVAPSLDALAASLNEANKWLKDQRELFAGLDDLTDEPPPADLLTARPRRAQRSAMGESA